MTNHDSHGSSGHDAAHAHESHSIRGYMFVYFALLIGTVFTVYAAQIDLGHHWNIVLALVIACVKAFLVGAYFMHLISEKKMIYSVLGFTTFFFVVLMGLTLYSMHNFPAHTVLH